MVRQGVTALKRQSIPPSHISYEVADSFGGYLEGVTVIPGVFSEWFDNIIAPAIAGVMVVFIAGAESPSLWINVNDALTIYVATAGTWMMFKLFRAGQGDGSEQVIRGFLLAMALLHAVTGCVVYMKVGPFGAFEWRGFSWPLVTLVMSVLLWTFFTAAVAVGARTAADLLALSHAGESALRGQQQEILDVVRVIVKQGVELDQKLDALAETSAQLDLREGTGGSAIEELGRRQASHEHRVAAEVARLQEIVQQFLEPDGDNR